MKRKVRKEWKIVTKFVNFNVLTVNAHYSNNCFL